MCTASQRYMGYWLLVVGGMGLVLGLVGVAAAGKTLYAANNGTDSFTCGDKSNPCRSISQAIINASSGAKIIVGPGRYSQDLNGNGNPGEPGEETGFTQFCGCVVNVNKALNIESRDGAATTVIDAVSANLIIVRISAGSASFGKQKKGFTLTSSNSPALQIDASASGVNASGNIAIKNGTSVFVVDGNSNVLSNNIVSAQSVFSGAYIVNGDSNLLKHNLANSGYGGFEVSGSNNTLVENVSSAQFNDGFHLSPPGTGNVLNKNVVAGSNNWGILIQSTGNTLTGNSILGSQSYGIWLFPGSNATITQNNIFGNEGFDGTNTTNCGLFNQSGTNINASNNFWGAATGPGASPADDFCSSGAGSSTTTTPVATKEFQVKTTTFLEEPVQIEPTSTSSSETPVTVPVRFLKQQDLKNGWLFRAAGEVSALRLEVTDLSGRTVYDSGFVKGESLSWTRVSGQNKPLSAGVYLYRLRAQDPNGAELTSELRKLIVRR